MAKRSPTVGSRELKTRLGTYLERVRRGETIIVTDRGTPVAELRPIQASEDPIEAALERMVADGLLTRGEPGPLTELDPIPLPAGVRVSDLIRADRDERGF
jgi:prevent-host-death family protein